MASLNLLEEIRMKRNLRPTKTVDKSIPILPKAEEIRPIPVNPPSAPPLPPVSTSIRPNVPPPPPPPGPPNKLNMPKFKPKTDKPPDHGALMNEIRNVRRLSHVPVNKKNDRSCAILNTKHTDQQQINQNHDQNQNQMKKNSSQGDLMAELSNKLHNRQKTSCGTSEKTNLVTPKPNAPRLETNSDSRTTSVNGNPPSAGKTAVGSSPMMIQSTHDISPPMSMGSPPTPVVPSPVPQPAPVVTDCPPPPPLPSVPVIELTQLTPPASPLHSPPFKPVQSPPQPMKPEAVAKPVQSPLHSPPLFKPVQSSPQPMELEAVAKPVQSPLHSPPVFKPVQSPPQPMKPEAVAKPVQLPLHSPPLFKPVQSSPQPMELEAVAKPVQSPLHSPPVFKPVQSPPQPMKPEAAAKPVQSPPQSVSNVFPPPNNMVKPKTVAESVQSPPQEESNLSPNEMSAKTPPVVKPVQSPPSPPSAIRPAFKKSTEKTSTGAESFIKESKQVPQPLNQQPYHQSESPKPRFYAQTGTVGSTKAFFERQVPTEHVTRQVPPKRENPYQTTNNLRQTTSKSSTIERKMQGHYTENEALELQALHMLSKDEKVATKVESETEPKKVESKRPSLSDHVYAILNSDYGPLSKQLTDERKVQTEIKQRISDFDAVSKPEPKLEKFTSELYIPPQRKPSVENIANQFERKPYSESKPQPPRVDIYATMLNAHISSARRSSVPGNAVEETISQPREIKRTKIVSSNGKSMPKSTPWLVTKGDIPNLLENHPVVSHLQEIHDRKLTERRATSPAINGTKTAKPEEVENMDMDILRQKYKFYIDTESASVLQIEKR